MRRPCSNNTAAARGHAQIEVAPVDARAVALAVQNVLRLRAHTDGLDLILIDHLGLDLIIACDIEADLLGNHQLDLDIVLSVVDDLLLDLKIADGTGQVVEIVGEDGGCKEEGQTDTALLKYVGGGEGIHVTGHGLHRIDVRMALSADHAIGLAVDLGNADDDVGKARPVGGVNIGQLIGRRPDVEEGVDGNQRNCRWTKSHGGSPLNVFFMIFGGFVFRNDLKIPKTVLGEHRKAPYCSLGTALALRLYFCPAFRSEPKSSETETTSYPSS